MKKIIFFIVLLFVIQSCKTLEQEEVFIPTKKEIKWAHNFYKDAEYLNYSIKWGLLQVGEVNIETAANPLLIDNYPYYNVKLDAKIQGAVGWITSLNNHYETFVDTLTLLPYKFTRNVQENKHRKKEFTIFDRQRDTAIVTDTTKSVINPKIRLYPISPTMQDMISALFLLRNASLERLSDGDTITMDVFLEKTSYNIRVKYLGKEKIKTKTEKGKINTLVLAPLIPDAGVLAGETPLKMWVTADDQRIPLKIQAKLHIGAVEMELKEYRGKNGED